MYELRAGLARWRQTMVPLLKEQEMTKLPMTMADKYHAAKILKQSGMTVEQIAEATARSVGTVRRWLRWRKSQ